MVMGGGAVRRLLVPDKAVWGVSSGWVCTLSAAGRAAHSAMALAAVGWGASLACAGDGRMVSLGWRCSAQRGGDRGGQAGRRIRLQARLAGRIPQQGAHGAAPNSAVRLRCPEAP